MGLNPNLSPLGLNADPFSACGYTGYDGDVNSLHSRLRDTIVNREIPPEVLAEVNEFLIQLEAARNETGGNLDESFESEDDDNNEDTGDEKKDDDFEVMMMMKFCKVFF